MRCSLVSILGKVIQIYRHLKIQQPKVTKHYVFQQMKYILQDSELSTWRVIIEQTQKETRSRRGWWKGMKRRLTSSSHPCHRSLSACSLHSHGLRLFVLLCYPGFSQKSTYRILLYKMRANMDLDESKHFNLDSRAFFCCDEEYLYFCTINCV